MKPFRPPKSDADQAAYIEHILKAIAIIQSTHPVDNEDIVGRLAVERCFEIIGEAASKLDDALKKDFPDVEWRRMKDARNAIIHGYFGVDYTALEITIEQHLPELKKKALDILKILQQ